MHHYKIDNNTQFTFEERDKGELPVIDFLTRRKCNSVLTTAFRRTTNNNIYQNWNAFALDTWKRETLKTLIERAYIVSSNKELLQKKFGKRFHEAISP